MSYIANNINRFNEEIELWSPYLFENISIKYCDIIPLTSVTSVKNVYILSIVYFEYSTIKYNAVQQCGFVQPITRLGKHTVMPSRYRKAF